MVLPDTVSFMKLSRWNFLAGLAIASSFSMLALQACSGGDDSSTTDSGPDGTTPGDSGNQDVATDSPQSSDAGCPTYNGSVEFCQAAVTKCNACPGSATISTCQRDNFDALCTYLNGVFSAQAQAALAACATDCDQDAETACQNAYLADASLTSAQQKAVTDYCARCGSSVGCAAQAEKAFNFIQYSDTLANDIDTKCTPDSGGPDATACLSGYGSCVLGIAFSAVKGAPCADAGTD